MIKHSGKKCSIDGCNNPLFARKYCRYHYNSLYLIPKQINKPKLTKKKEILNKEYSEKREEFIRLMRLNDRNGRIFCIFCGGEIKTEPSLHHALGRDDDIMLDDRFWFLSHNYCHVSQYHSMSCNDIPWWGGYLARVKTLITSVSIIILKIEVNRMEKALYEQQKGENTETIAT